MLSVLETLGPSIVQRAEKFFQRDWINPSVSHAQTTSGKCESCEPLRESLLLEDLGKDVFWLVDIVKLQATAKALLSRRCHFCSYIYKIFWESQPGEYRLGSQLWEPDKTSPTHDAADWKAELHKVPRIWRIIMNKLKSSGASAHFPRNANDNFDCKTQSCPFCHASASFEVNNLDCLCAPCRQEVTRYSCSDGQSHQLRPAVPLLFTIQGSSDSNAMLTLEVRHAGEAFVPSAEDAMSKVKRWKLYTHESDPTAEYIPPFRRYSYDHELVFRQIRDWIGACDTHEICASRRSSPVMLPTRVLEWVDGGIRLRQTAGRVGAYVALSYCWGGEQPCRLLKGNKAAYEREVEIQTLPLTVQDALNTTRLLGYSFCWIDSMCIVQDDDADKDREISRMAQVYSNAVLTICATKAASCGEGFLEAGESPGMSAVLSDVGVILPCVLPSGVHGNARLIDRAEYSESKESLNSRGWTLQENLMSSRLLRFDACLTWECDQVTVTKTASSLHGGIDCATVFGDLFKWHEYDGSATSSLRRVLHKIVSTIRHEGSVAHATPPTGVRPPAPSSNATELVSVWSEAVAMFSDRLLTVAEDKLPALSAVAECCAQYTNDTYVAGLWRSRLLHELMWTASSDDAKRVVRRRHAWRAPSWSWACIDAHIDCVGPGNRILKCQYDGSRLIGRPTLSEVMACSVELKTEQLPFGQVNGGVVSVRGPLRRGIWKRGPMDDTIEIEGVRLTHMETVPMLTVAERFAKVILDMPSFRKSNPPDFEAAEIGGSHHIWCLPMREEILVTTQQNLPVARNDSGTHITLLDGLALLPVDHSRSIFRRVGVWVTDFTVITSDDQHPFLEQAHVEIAIV